MADVAVRKIEPNTRELDEQVRHPFPIVVAFFHHPQITSGPHGGATVERESAAVRRLYLPLFRKYHVRMTITGHDHLYDHYVERYDDGQGSYRMDHIVSGGGGAPIYSYRGEPDLALFASTATIRAACRLCFCIAISTNCVLPPAGW